MTCLLGGSGRVPGEGCSWNGLEWVWSDSELEDWKEQVQVEVMMCIQRPYPLFCPMSVLCGTII